MCAIKGVLVILGILAKTCHRCWAFVPPTRCTASRLWNEDCRVEGKIDFAAIGYPAVRAAFNDTLQLCVAKLSKAEIRLAEEILDADALDDETAGFGEMLADTALYSRKGTPAALKTKRAIDRIVPKLAFKDDLLKATIAARLPAAVFSIFGIEAAQEPGMVLARDLLDDGRAIRVMDNALAALVAKRGETLIAARFVDLGPWQIGFGIVLPLRKSEALAISLTLFEGADLEARRSGLHELLYVTELHDENLVMTALEPLIGALAMAVDADLIDMDDLTAGLGSLFGGKASKGKRRAIAP